MIARQHMLKHFFILRNEEVILLFHFTNDGLRHWGSHTQVSLTIGEAGTLQRTWAHIEYLVLAATFQQLHVYAFDEHLQSSLCSSIDT